MSCARLALEKNNIPISTYYASEIDTYAIDVAINNRPDTVQIGDIKQLQGYGNKWFHSQHGDLQLSKIDLLIGGSPCQDLSIAKNNRKGLEGDRSSLFYDYVRILREVKPKYFILENVASMPKEAKDTITKELGVEPILINASLVSAQNRKRLFWTNIPGVTQPDDRHIYLKDILLDGDTEDLKSLCITATYHKKNEQNYLQKRDGQMIRIGHLNKGGQGDRIYSDEGKSVNLSANGGGRGAKTGLYLIQRPRGKNKGGIHTEKSPTLTSSSFEHNNSVRDGEVLRKLHPIECERLQGMPDNWTNPTGKMSNTQRYKMAGNAFNVDVVAHIIGFIKKND